jgi:hypothetical protein
MDANDDNLTNFWKTVKSLNDLVDLLNQKLIAIVAGLGRCLPDGSHFAHPKDILSSLLILIR